MLITFEGIDGSGKSTQIGLLREALEKEGLEVSVFREPGGSDVSEMIRGILLNPELEIDPVTELLLFSAARSQLVAEQVNPLLKENKIVILDRFYDSTIAYQGYGRASLPLEQIQQINTIAAHSLVPDLTFYIKLSREDAEERISHVRKDRMESAGESFFDKVIEGFDHLAENETRFVTVNGLLPVQEIHSQVLQKVLQQL
ncbi:dTMP kinase [Balneola sp. MJW-20]|uniref:dTMP kinase n=1 Tax=Gracilimonas aurantiaca TaxID=3234185 RepID=UPI0034660DE7